MALEKSGNVIALGVDCFIPSKGGEPKTASGPTNTGELFPNKNSNKPKFKTLILCNLHR